MLTGQKESAEALRFGLAAGSSSVADAVAWADRVVVEDPAPDVAIIEVALAVGRAAADVIALLGFVAGQADAITVTRRVLAGFLRELDAHPERGDEIARRLYQGVGQGWLPEEHFGWEASALDDEFDLARTGFYASRESPLRQLRSYLSREASTV
jgi:hypothetical protein